MSIYPTSTDELGVLVDGVNQFLSAYYGEMLLSVPPNILIAVHSLTSQIEVALDLWSLKKIPVHDAMARVVPLLKLLWENTEIDLPSLTESAFASADKVSFFPYCFTRFNGETMRHKTSCVRDCFELPFPVVSKGTGRFHPIHKVFEFVEVAVPGGLLGGKRKKKNKVAHPPTPTSSSLPKTPKTRKSRSSSNKMSAAVGPIEPTSIKKNKVAKRVGFREKIQTDVLSGCDMVPFDEDFRLTELPYGTTKGQILLDQLVSIPVCGIAQQQEMQDESPLTNLALNYDQWEPLVYDLEFDFDVPALSSGSIYIGSFPYDSNITPDNVLSVFDIRKDLPGVKLINIAGTDRQFKYHHKCLLPMGARPMGNSASLSVNIKSFAVRVICMQYLVPLSPTTTATSSGTTQVSQLVSDVQKPMCVVRGRLAGNAIFKVPHVQKNALYTPTRAIFSAVAAPVYVESHTFSPDLMLQPAVTMPPPEVSQAVTTTVDNVFPSDGTATLSYLQDSTGDFFAALIFSGVEIIAASILGPAGAAIVPAVMQFFQIGPINLANFIDEKIATVGSMKTKTQAVYNANPGIDSLTGVPEGNGDSGGLAPANVFSFSSALDPLKVPYSTFAGDAFVWYNRQPKNTPAQNIAFFENFASRHMGGYPAQWEWNEHTPNSDVSIGGDLDVTYFQGEANGQATVLPVEYLPYTPGVQNIDIQAKVINDSLTSAFPGHLFSEYPAVMAPKRTIPYGFARPQASQSSTSLWRASGLMIVYSSSARQLPGSRKLKPEFLNSPVAVVPPTNALPVPIVLTSDGWMPLVNVLPSTMLLKTALEMWSGGSATIGADPSYSWTTAKASYYAIGKPVSPLNLITWFATPTPISDIYRTFMDGDTSVAHYDGSIDFGPTDDCHSLMGTCQFKLGAYLADTVNDGRFVNYFDGGDTTSVPFFQTFGEQCAMLLDASSSLLRYRDPRIQYLPSSSVVGDGVLYQLRFENT
jgi:hypothetical protein